MEEIDRYGKELYEEMMNGSQYVKEICQHIDKKEGVGYVFKELTLIDFLFMESCVYLLGLFDKTSRVDLEGMR
jgi:hypothetical protein